MTTSTQEGPTREQDNAVELIGLAHGGATVMVRPTSPRAGCITAILPDGQALHIDEDGFTVHRGVDFADWPSRP